MQKRLFGILGQHRRHRGGMRRCHHLVDGAVGGARPPRASPRQPAESRRRRASPTSPTDQILKIDLGQRARDPRPEQGAGLDLDRRPVTPSTAAWSTSTRTSRSSRRSPRPARHLGRRQDPDLHPADAQVQQRRPDRRRRLRLQLKRLIDPRTAAPYSYVMAEVAGAARPARAWPAQGSGPDRRRHRRALDKLGVVGAGRQDLRRQPGHAGDLLPERRWPSGSRCRSRRSGSPARTRPRPRTTSAPARSSSTPGTTTARSSSSRTRTGTATSSRP